MSRAETLQLVAELKDAEQDLEWYPSTDEIIGKLSRDIYKFIDGKGGSLLDVGAGDGRVLTRANAWIEKRSKGFYSLKLYAIEKSTVHLQNMPKQIVVVGTDFLEQSMVDKRVAALFSNPPYSEYEQWAVKLIREAASETLYLVIPTRWRDSKPIADALKFRKTKAFVIGTFDFESADRQARAKVNLIRIGYRGGDAAFNAAIEEMLPELQEFERLAGLLDVQDDNECCAVADGSGNMIEALVMAYNADMDQLLGNYRELMKVSPKLLAELGVTKKYLLEGVRMKISGLKDKYWKTLFERLSDLTKRLASKQRKAFLDSLIGKAVIDFTEPNIYATLIWISKWSNDYFDEQLIDLFRTMSEQCNVVNYKSNQRTWQKGQWRYSDMPVDFSHYRLGRKEKLEYRLVLQAQGGISTSEYKFNQCRGLDERTMAYLQDCVTVMCNLGFDCNDGPYNYDWKSNKQIKFYGTDRKVLLAVRAFKNKNIHLHYSTRVMLAINVEAGRLLGWLRDPVQAAEELQATEEEAAVIRQVFNSSYRIGQGNLLRLN